MILFPIITIFFTAFIARIILGSWFSPGSFFSICWSFFLIVPLVFAASFNVDIIGLWFIVIFSMSCASGSIIASKVSNDDRNINLKPNELFAYNLMPSYLFLCLISFLGLYFLFSYALITYNFGYNSFNWLSIPNLIAIDRYNDELNYPFIIKYSLYCIYPANLLSGILIGLKKTKSIQFKIVILLPLIAAFILGVLEGARSSILLGLILFFSSWLSTSLINFSQNKKKKSYLKVGIGLTFSVGTFTSIFIFIQWLRQGMDKLIIDLLFDRIQAYFFGYLAAFSQWFINYEFIHLSGGLTTLAGPSNLLGIIDRPLGFYNPISIGESTTTNIFTAFRGLIIDFSIPGAIFFAFVIGFVFQLFFQKSYKRNLISTLPLSMFYAFTFYSPLISIFHYNSIIFSWIIVFFLILFGKDEYQNHYS